MSDSSIEPKDPLPPPNRQPSHNIARKPVPVSAPSNPPSYDPPTSHSTTHPYTRPTLLSRLRTRWTLLRRRTRILLITLLLILLALILGLSIGLSLRSSSPQNLPLPSENGGPYSGDLTYYAPGLGACGITSSASEDIVAVSHLLFDAVQSGSDPNQNPLCGRRIRAKRVKEGNGERSVDLTVVDRCTGCKETDIDVSLSVFETLADESLGRVGVEWSWLD